MEPVMDRILIPWKKDSRRVQPSGQETFQNSLSVDKLPDVLLSRSLDGFKCPNWKELTSDAKNATTPITLGIWQSVDLRQLPTYTYERNISLTTPNWVPCLSTYWALPNAFPTWTFSSSLQSAARAGCRSKLNKAIYEFQKPLQSQILVGEVRETLRFLRSPLKQTQKLASVFRSRYEAARIKNALHEASASWLEFRFAILPLLGDINSIITVLESDKGLFVKDRVSFVNTEKSVTTGSTNVTHGSVSYHNEVISTCINTIKFGLLASLTTNLAGLTNYLREDLHDTSEYVLTAWELTPWSFLVDYFVNVQDVLLAATHNYESLLAWTSDSLILEKTYRRTNTSVNMSGQTRNFRLVGDFQYPARSIMTERRVSRDVLSSLVPPVTFKVPTGSIQLANISALILNKLT
jgi:hypothetical protein